MDRGRMIDHAQNTNAKYFDKFSSNRTSVKLMYPPGGKSTIRLGWDYEEPETFQSEKIIPTPLKQKHITEMASNEIYNCMKDQAGVNHQGSYRKPVTFEIPMSSNYRKTPTKQTTTPLKPTYLYEKMNNKPSIEVKDNNQIEDYYPYHLTFSYNSNSNSNSTNSGGTIKTLIHKGNCNINNNHKSYEEFLQQQLQAKDIMSKGTPYDVGMPLSQSQEIYGNSNVNTNRNNYNHPPQTNYHNMPSVNNNINGNNSSNMTNKTEHQLESNAQIEGHNEINWDSCFNRRKPAVTKYNFIY